MDYTHTIELESGAEVVFYVAENSHITLAINTADGFQLGELPLTKEVKLGIVKLLIESL